MSLEYPCAYWEKGKCKKFSEDGVESWCVEGPCGEMRPTNADRIRAMSDEEFAMWMAKKRVEEIVKVLGLAGVSVKLIESVEPVEEITEAKAKNILKWLKQPAEVEG